MVKRSNNIPIVDTSVYQSVVSGNFNINGVIPAGASITLTKKEYGSKSAAAIFASNLPVVDGSPWSFIKAASGKNYEIQAQVIVNGAIITTSAPLVITAPADNETLTINIEGKNQTGNTVISGNVEVNGFIPAGSSISVQGRQLGAQTFTTVAQGLPGKTRQFMSYTTAVPGTTYEVQSILKNAAGQTIGTSSILTLTAPALDETLVINSGAAPVPTLPAGGTPSTPPASEPTATAQPPAGSTTIAGSINLNGATPPNARIVVFYAPLNSTNNQVAVNNVSPTNGATWSWTSAQNATWYTLFAVLKQHNSNGTDTDIATSAPVTVAAPAANITFTLNSGFSLSAPGGPITVNCQTYNSGPNQNNWNVQITLGTVPSAQSYWIQLGNNSGGNNILNTASQSNTFNAIFNNSTTYYAQYAYSNVAVAPLGSSEYSPFTSGTPLQCSH